jgi:hypothetical protein
LRYNTLQQTQPAKTEALENDIKKVGSMILAAVPRVYVSSRSKNYGRVLEYPFPQLGQSVLVVKPLTADYVFQAVAQTNVDRQHAVHQ